LWDDIGGDTGHLVDRLVAFARRRGWTAEMLQPIAEEGWRGAAKTAPSVMGPGPGHLPLWGKGALTCTPEYGVEPHTAALALLGMTGEVEQRLWRGQAPLLLPLLDSLRLGICRRFSRRYGPRWPVSWQLPPSPWEAAEVRENPLACQWAHLEYLVKNCPAFEKERRSLPFIGLARSIRNRLAHFRPVEFGSYAALCRQMDKVGDVLG